MDWPVGLVEIMVCLNNFHFHFRNMLHYSPLRTECYRTEKMLKSFDRLFVWFMITTIYPGRAWLAAAVVVISIGNWHSQSTVKSFFTRWIIIYSTIIYKLKLQLLAVHWERLQIDLRLQMMELHVYLSVFFFCQLRLIHSCRCFFIALVLIFSPSTSLPAPNILAVEKRLHCWE